MTLDTQHDLSTFVLHLLDDHLAAMQRIRDRMRLGGTTSPGGRRAVALESITLAEAYASDLAGALAAGPRERQSSADGIRTRKCPG